jgi:hypothetical protein
VSSASGALNVVTGGDASQGRKQYGLPPKTESVVVARLDTLVGNGSIPVPHVIKIDVEGAELRLLKGAVKTLQRHSPHLVIENHGAETARGVVRFLLDAGYHVFGYLAEGDSRIYREVLAPDVDAISSPYSLHFCAASRDRELLRPTIDG